MFVRRTADKIDGREGRKTQPKELPLQEGVSTPETRAGKKKALAGIKQKTKDSESAPSGVGRRASAGTIEGKTRAKVRNTKQLQGKKPKRGFAESVYSGRKKSLISSAERTVEVLIGETGKKKGLGGKKNSKMESKAAESA